LLDFTSWNDWEFATGQKGISELFFITAQPTNSHPYRFVFIQGCDTGKAAFCEAFGIPAQPLNNALFAANGVRSRAFLGFTTDADFNPEPWPQSADLLANFWQQWNNNVPLNQSVNNAVNFGSGGLDANWVIYGAADLYKGAP